MSLTLNKASQPVALDIKAVSEDGLFSGYASVFSQRDMGGDIVMPGAFAKSLQAYPASRVKLLWQHDQSEPIGVWASLTEDARGLKAEGRLILDTARGREAHALMKAGALDGLSIGFRTIRDEMDRKSGSRLLHEVELREISVVTFPANASATVAAVKHFQTDFSLIARAINDARATL